MKKILAVALIALAVATVGGAMRIVGLSGGDYPLNNFLADVGYNLLGVSLWTFAASIPAALILGAVKIVR